MLAATVAKYQQISIIDAWKWTFRDFQTVVTQDLLKKRTGTATAKDVLDLAAHLEKKGVVNYGGKYSRNVSD